MHVPSYCRQASRRRRKRLINFPRFMQRGYTEVSAGITLAYMPVFVWLLKKLRSHLPELDEARACEYSQWSVNEIRKWREFVRSGGHPSDYKADYELLCQSLELPREMAEVMEGIREKMARVA